MSALIEYPWAALKPGLYCCHVPGHQPIAVSVQRDDADVLTVTSPIDDEKPIETMPTTATFERLEVSMHGLFGLSSVKQLLAVYGASDHQQ